MHNTTELKFLPWVLVNVSLLDPPSCLEENKLRISNENNELTTLILPAKY